MEPLLTLNTRSSADCLWSTCTNPDLLVMLQVAPDGYCISEVNMQFVTSDPWCTSRPLHQSSWLQDLTMLIIWSDNFHILSEVLSNRCVSTWWMIVQDLRPKWALMKLFFKLYIHFVNSLYLFAYKITLLYPLWHWMMCWGCFTIGGVIFKRRQCAIL
jgi:hypothetical protein